MGKPDLGSKLVCADCAERFYDLNRSPAVCPKCGARQPAPKPRIHLKPGPAWHPRRQHAPVAAEADEGSAAAAPDEAEEAAEDADEDAADADADTEHDAEAPG